MGYLICDFTPKMSSFILETFRKSSMTGKQMFNESRRYQKMAGW